MLHTGIHFNFFQNKKILQKNKRVNNTSVSFPEPSGKMINLPSSYLGPLAGEVINLPNSWTIYRFSFIAGNLPQIIRTALRVGDY